jgi:hypothetical protein
MYEQLPQLGHRQQRRGVARAFTPILTKTERDQYEKLNPKFANAASQGNVDEFSKHWMERLDQRRRQ